MPRDAPDRSADGRTGSGYAQEMDESLAAIQDALGSPRQEILHQIEKLRASSKTQKENKAVRWKLARLMIQRKIELRR